MSRQGRASACIAVTSGGACKSPAWQDWAAPQCGTRIASYVEDDVTVFVEVVVPPAYDPATGTGPDNPRQQVNEITSFPLAPELDGCTHVCVSD